MALRARRATPRGLTAATAAGDLGPVRLRGFLVAAVVVVVVVVMMVVVVVIVVVVVVLVVVVV